MNILIVGGYGFIGSNLAEKLHKEGHSIFLIDKFINEKIKFTFKPVIFVYNAADNDKCSKIFELYNLDIIIYAVNSNINDDKSKQEQMSGLVNILDLSRIHNIKKFILFSDKENNIALKQNKNYFFLKKQEELYCKGWQDIYNIPVSIVKMTNVYGPYMAYSTYPSVINQFCCELLKKKELDCNEDTLNYNIQNYIYIMDLTEAVKLIIEKKSTPFYIDVYSKENVIIDHLIRIVKETKIITKNNTSFDNISRSKSSNEKDTFCQRELHWTARYNLVTGMEAVWQWYKTAYIPQSSPKMQEKQVWRKEILPYIENIVIFAITAALNIAMRYNTSFINTTGIDYSQIYIMLMGLLYGKRQSIIAAVLSMGLFIISIGLKGIDSVAAFYHMEYIIHLIAYLFMAIITGYITDKYEFYRHNMIEQMQKMTEQQTFIRQSYSDAVKIKNKFYRQIENSTDSIGWLYNSIHKLDFIESEKIYTAAIEVIIELMDTGNAVIYTVNKNNTFLRQKIKQGKAVARLPISVNVEKYAYLKILINKRQTFINKMLEKNLPDMAVPVISHDRVIAVIAVYNIPFEYFSLHYERRIKIISLMLAESLDRAAVYEAKTYNETHIKNTIIMNENSFIELEREVQKRGMDSYCKFMVGEINQISCTRKNLVKNINRFSDYLKNMTREDDFIGLVEGQLYILMPELSFDMVEIVKQRFWQKGINLSLVKN